MASQNRLSASRALLRMLLAINCLVLPRCAWSSQPARANPPYTRIRALLNNGHANDAITALHMVLSIHPQDATAHNLLCRVEYQEERWADAIPECEAAVKLQPLNSQFHLWLGRVYGQQAQHGSKWAAFGLARKVHAEFQSAVQLDPRDIAALADLAEYETEAPGFLGGGLDKAQTTALLLQPLDAEKYHELLAKIAFKQKDIPTAEREMQLAVEQSKFPASAWMHLAGFRAWQKNRPAMELALQQGRNADPNHGIAWVEGASVLIRYKQNFPIAEQMLRKYLASSNQSENAPAFQVHTQLGKLLALQGNKSDAQREFSAAHALASDYAGARSDK